MQKNEQKNAGKKKMAASLALVGVLGLGAAGTLAYLTDTETTTNTFTVGDVSIDVEERHYPGNDSDKVKDLVANEVVDKDPIVENTGKNEAIVFTSVDVPMAKVVMFDDKAADINTQPSNQELFTLLKEDGSGNYAAAAADGATSTAGSGGKVILQGAKNAANHNDGWTLIKTVYVSKDGKTSDTDNTVTLDNCAFMRYIYGYNTVIGADHETEKPLFSKVMLNNVVEGYVDSTVQDMTIKSYAIQAANLRKVNITNVDGNHVVTIAKPATDGDQDAKDHAQKLTDADKTSGQALSGSEIQHGYDVSGILSDVWNVYIAQNNEYGDAEDAENNNAKDLHGEDRTSTETTKLNIDLSIDNTQMRIGETTLASVTVDTNLSEKGYVLSITGTSGIVSLDPTTGAIKALKAGTTEITATSNAKNKDGKAAVAKVTITVRPISEDETGTPSTTNKQVDTENRTNTNTDSSQNQGAGE